MELMVKAMIMDLMVKAMIMEVMVKSPKEDSVQGPGGPP